MTHKERIMAALRGEKPDRVPWAPRWELWFDAARKDGRLPEKYRDWDFFDVTRDLGMGIKGNRGRVYVPRMKNVEVVERQRGNDILTEYVTPVGTVSTRYTITPELERQGVGGREMEFMVKRVEDYDVAIYIIENTEYIPTYEEFAAYEARIGDDGVAWCGVGECPLHRMMRHYTGYEQSYYEMYDHPKEVERLLEALYHESKEMERVALASPAEIIGCDGNYDWMLTPPPLYEKYFLPHFQELSAAVHAQGKLLKTHTDGENRGLLGLIGRSGFDVAEAFTPPPMTSISVAEARRVWGDRITIWGGIASTVLSEPFTDADFEAHLMNLFREIAPGDRFVIGLGDNMPTDAKFERLLKITELVETYGKYPIHL